MKRLLAILMIMALVITSFSGCGGKESSADVDTSKGIRVFEGVTINMIAEQQTPTVALSKQLGKFEELTGIKVNLEMAPFDNVVQKITLAMQSGSSDYDVIAVPYQFLGNLAVNGFIQPLEPLMNNKDLAIIPDYDPDDIIKGMWDASGKWEDTVYGVPANSCIMFFAYRADLFEMRMSRLRQGKVRLDLKVPTDWGTYRDIAESSPGRAERRLRARPDAGFLRGLSMSGNGMTRPPANAEYAWSFGGGNFR